VRHSKKIAAIAIATAGALGLSGLAFAYWTSDGDGNGVASVQASSAPVEITQETVLAPMFPGDTAQDLTVNVKNVDPSASIKVDSVMAYLEVIQPPAPAPAIDCEVDDFELMGSAAPGSAGTAVAMDWVAVELAAAADQDATGTIQFNNSEAENQDGCKGASLKLHYFTVTN
jgi:hypothetical protein